MKKTTKNPVVDDATPAKPSWTDAWQRTEVAPEEVQELLRACTHELKARGKLVSFEINRVVCIMSCRILQSDC